MISRRIVIGAVAVGATAAAVLAASPALATVTKVNLTAGSQAAGTALSVTASSQNQLSLKVVGNNAPLTCPTTVALTASTTVGNNKLPAGVASVSNSSWPPIMPNSRCLASTTAATVSHLGTWTLNVTDQSAPNPSGSTAPQLDQVTPGSLTNVGVRVQAGSCRFDVTGTVYGNYKNSSTPTLTLKVASSTSTPVVPQADLTVGNIVLSSGATNCLAGQLVNGSKVVVAADTTFNVSATAGTSAANPLWVRGLP